jgi:plastocyanin
MNSKILLGIAVFILVLVGAYYLFSLPSAEVPGAQEIVDVIGADVVSGEIRDFSFIPSEIRIKPGTKIVWTNRDKAAHTVTSDTGIFASTLLNQGQSFEFVFTEKGTYSYYCVPHPFMKGVVVVE